MGTARRARLVLSLIVVLAACAAGIVLTVDGWQQRALVRPVAGGLSAEGHIVGYTVHRYKGSSYSAAVEYRAADGQVVRFTAPSSQHKPSIGSSVDVSYSALDPWHAHDLSMRGWTWQWPFFTGVAVDILLIALLTCTAVVTRRVRRHAT